MNFESGGGSGSQDFDLNLAPIIDCMTVLIAFMLASAAFVSIGILDAGVAAAGASPNDATPPSINVSVELGRDHTMTVKVTGVATSTTPIVGNTKNGQDWNYDELTRNLTALKRKWPDVAAITLSADNKTEYKDLVRTMEALRKTIPVVLLGGF